MVSQYLVRRLKILAYHLIDAKKGRSVAKSYNLPIIGTLKVLLIAKEKGAISSVKEQILKLGQSGFRFSSAIIGEILREANESM